MQGAADSNIPDTPASPDERPRFRPRPWEHLETPYDVEVWIEEHNRSMQDNIRATETGTFFLAGGGIGDVAVCCALHAR